MKKVLLAILGIFFVSIGIFFSILYLNLFNLGYSFLEYVYFISSRIECLIIILGILILYFSVHEKGEKK